ncbi:MAG: hypothetical protein PHX04_02870 [Bacilli bacterium]|nr:hypothetical protein [Bacilli bacterium]
MRLKTFILLSTFTLFIWTSNVSADCTYLEKAALNEVAAMVKTNYEVIEENVTEEFVDPDTQEVGTIETVKTTFKISIYNIVKDLYVVESNSFTNEDKNLYYEDTVDGVYSFISEDTGNIIKYEYNVYSNLESCSGDVLKSYSFIKPKINIFSQYSMCEGLDHVPYCKRYITEEVNVPEGSLNEEISKYVSDEKKEEKAEEVQSKSGIKEILKENYIYIIIGVIGVSSITILSVVIVKKRSAL